jgi:hypothetical protein
LLEQVLDEPDHRPDGGADSPTSAARDVLSDGGAGLGAGHDMGPQVIPGSSPRDKAKLIPSQLTRRKESWSDRYFQHADLLNFVERPGLSGGLHPEPARVTS